MKRTHLKSKEANRQLEHYAIHLSKKDQVELQEDEDKKIILINKQPSFFFYEGNPVPTLKYLQENVFLLKRIVVDMGAIKFVINGADVMRPGITNIEEGIAEGNFVVILDVDNRKPLAVGVTMFSGEEMREMTEGKVIKNIHYVGDDLWKME